VRLTGGLHELIGRFTDTSDATKDTAHSVHYLTEEAEAGRLALQLYGEEAGAGRLAIELYGEAALAQVPKLDILSAAGGRLADSMRLVGQAILDAEMASRISNVHWDPETGATLGPDSILSPMGLTTGGTLRPEDYIKKYKLNWYQPPGSGGGGGGSSATKKVTEEVAATTVADFAAAFAAESQRSDLQVLIGSVGVNFLDTLTKAMHGGFKGSTEQLGKDAVAMRDELKSKLPPDQASFIGDEFMQALKYSVAHGGEDANGELKLAMEQMNQLMQGGSLDVKTGTVMIAKDVDALAKKLGISGKEVIQDFAVLINSGILPIVGDLKKLPIEVQKIIDDILKKLDEGAINAAEAARRISNAVGGGGGGNFAIPAGSHAGLSGATGAGSFSGIPTNLLGNVTTGRDGQLTWNPVNTLAEITSGNPEFWNALLHGVSAGAVHRTDLPDNLVNFVLDQYHGVAPPGFAQGLWDVPGPRGMGDIFPAMLAPGEMVMPAAAADLFRNLAVGGGSRLGGGNTFIIQAPTGRGEDIVRALESFIEREMDHGMSVGMRQAGM
jgi:hypothetical protein